MSQYDLYIKAVIADRMREADEARRNLDTRRYRRTRGGLLGRRRHQR